MAMRLYTKDELETELAELGFTRTKEKLDTSTCWKHRDGGYVLIPHDLEHYGDWILDRILEQLNLLYREQ